MIPNLVPSEIRRPVVAGAFYPSGAQELESTVEAMLSQTTEKSLDGLCGVVTPHAGYPYSGPIAGAAFSLLAHSNDAPNRLTALRPVHGTTTLVKINDIRGHSAVLAAFDEVIAA
jgi:AmmeMemoRadiSam system protein B